MARLARVVVPGVPHHVTQPGNRRLQTFFSSTDYRAYKALLAEHCAALGARGWGRGFANLEGGDVPFDLAKLAKIEAALERQGVRVWRDADSTRFLAQRNSGGQFIDDLDLGPLVILPKSPSRTAVVEELLHLGQWRKAGRRIDDARIRYLEIEAQHRLLALGQRKGWTENEISQLRKALEFWQNKAMQ